MQDTAAVLWHDAFTYAVGVVGFIASILAVMVLRKLNVIESDRVTQEQHRELHDKLDRVAENLSYLRGQMDRHLADGGS